MTLEVNKEFHDILYNFNDYLEDIDDCLDRNDIKTINASVSRLLQEHIKEEYELLHKSQLRDLFVCLKIASDQLDNNIQYYVSHIKGKHNISDTPKAKKFALLSADYYDPSFSSNFKLKLKKSKPKTGYFESIPKEVKSSTKVDSKYIPGKGLCAGEHGAKLLIFADGSHTYVSPGESTASYINIIKTVDLGPHEKFPQEYVIKKIYDMTIKEMANHVNEMHEEMLESNAMYLHATTGEPITTSTDSGEIYAPTTTTGVKGPFYAESKISFTQS